MTDHHQDEAQRSEIDEAIRLGHPTLDDKPKLRDGHRALAVAFVVGRLIGRGVEVKDIDPDELAAQMANEWEWRKPLLDDAAEDAYSTLIETAIANREKDPEVRFWAQLTRDEDQPVDDPFIDGTADRPRPHRRRLYHALRLKAAAAKGDLFPFSQRFATLAMGDRTTRKGVIQRTGEPEPAIGKRELDALAAHGAIEMKPPPRNSRGHGADEQSQRRSRTTMIRFIGGNGDDMPY